MSRDYPVHTLVDYTTFEAVEKSRKRCSETRGQWIRDAIKLRLSLQDKMRVVSLSPGISVFIPSE